MKQKQGGKKDRKREEALIALVEEATVEKAAERIGIGRCTLFRWLKEDSFQQDYRNFKREILGHAITRLQKASSSAVNTLIEIVEDKEKPSSVRVMSARSILDFANRGIEIESLEEGILNLEKIIKMRGGT